MKHLFIFILAVSSVSVANTQNKRNILLGHENEHIIKMQVQPSQSLVQQNNLKNINMQFALEQSAIPLMIPKGPAAMNHKWGFSMDNITKLDAKPACTMRYFVHKLLREPIVDFMVLDNSLDNAQMCAETSADFAFSYDYDLPNMVYFEPNLVQVNGKEFYWDFGDGESSRELDPKHTYEDLGDFNVSLVVVNNDEACTKIMHDNIIIDKLYADAPCKKTYNGFAYTSTVENPKGYHFQAFNNDADLLVYWYVNNKLVNDTEKGMEFEFEAEGQNEVCLVEEEKFNANCETEFCTFINVDIDENLSKYYKKSFDHKDAYLDFEYSAFSIYPNPTNDFLNLDNTNTLASRMIIRNVTGKELMNQPITSNFSQIDVQGFNSGMYFIELYNSNNERIDEVQFMKN